MVKEEKSKKLLQAEQKLVQAKTQYEKAMREEREKLRTEQNRHKYMIGGCVAKYFPECWSFSEQEINRIIACAFKNRDVQNMIEAVIRECPKEEPRIAESEVDEDGAFCMTIKNISTERRYVAGVLSAMVGILPLSKHPISAEKNVL